MPNPRRSPLLEFIRHLADTDSASLSDRELLDRFTAQHDDNAFRSLLRRHGPMVLRVCQGVIKDHDTAQDTVQATFLVLATKTASLHSVESLGAWLHKVAYDLARQTLDKRQRQLAREARVLPRTVATPLAEVSAEELLTILDEEVAKLPERYRVPLILCYLEGKNIGHVAQELGCAQSTLYERFQQGRELLRKRLTRRGLTLSVTALGSLFLQNAASAAVPPLLVASTVRAAAFIAAGKPVTAGVVSVQVAALVRGAAEVLFWTKLKVVLAVVLVGGVVAGGGVFVQQKLAERRAESVMGNLKSDTRDPLSGIQTSRMQDHGRVDDSADPLPYKAIARIGTLRFRSAGMVYDMGLPADGSMIAAAAGRSISVWDPKSGKLTARFPLVEETPCFACSADGKLFAVSELFSSNIVRLVDATSGREVHRIFAHHADPMEWYNRVCGILFGPRNDWLITWSSDQTIRRWSIATGKELWRLDWRPPPIIHGLVLSPDGNHLAARVAFLGETDCTDKQVIVWDVATGRERHRLRFADQDAGQESALAFSPDSKTLAVAAEQCDQPAKIIRWDVETGAELNSFSLHDSTTCAVVFSPDGKTLVTGGNRRMICFWDPFSGKEIREIGPLDEQIRRLAFTGDGNALAFSGGECRVQLWDPTTGKRLLDNDGFGDIITALTYSPAGNLLAVASSKVVRIYDLSLLHHSERSTRRMKELHQFCHKDRVSEIAFSRDGSILISTSSDSMIRLWDTKSGDLRQTETVSHRCSLFGLAISQDGGLAAVLTRPNNITLWDTAVSKEREHLSVLSELQHLVYLRDLRFSFSPDGRRLVGWSGQCPNMLHWDLTTKWQLPSMGEHDAGLTAAPAFSPNGRTIATASREGSIYLWEISTGRPRWIAKNVGYTTSLTFSPDGRFLALGNNGFYHQRDEDGKLLHPDWSTNTCIRLLDVNDGKVIYTFDGHLGGVTSLAFSPDGKTLASGSLDTTVLLWDTTCLPNSLSSCGNPPVPVKFETFRRTSDLSE